MAKRTQKTDYDVGYKKPPKHTQFKKGVPPNPIGRPKGSGSLMAAIRRQGDEIAPVKLDGKSATYYELLARRLFHDAVNGDLKAIAQILKADKELPLTEPEGDWMKLNGVYLPMVDGVAEMVVEMELEEPPPPEVQARQAALIARFPNYDPDRPMEEWGPDGSDSVH